MLWMCECVGSVCVLWMCECVSSVRVVDVSMCEFCVCCGCANV